MTTASCDMWSSGLAKSDRIGEVPHAHATFGQVVDEVQGVPGGAAQPIQGVHDDHVAIAGLVQGLVESGPVGGGSGFLIHVDSFGGDALRRAARRSVGPDPVSRSTRRRTQYPCAHRIECLYSYG